MSTSPAFPFERFVRAQYLRQCAMSLEVTCPKCGARVVGAGCPFACPGCQLQMGLHAGPAASPAVIPPAPPPGTPQIFVRWASTFTYRMGQLDPYGVAEGQTDPVTGLIPIEQHGVGYPDIYALIVWRSIAWVGLVVGVLIPLPLTLLLLYLAITDSAGFLWGAVPFGVIAGLLIYRSGVRKEHWVQIVGRQRTIKIRFDRPFYRRQRFHDELLRRTGVAPGPIP